MPTVALSILYQYQSKLMQLGYPDLLKAYLGFRQKLKDTNNPARGGGPQLIIMGHGSVDDPDGTMI